MELLDILDIRAVWKSSNGWDGGASAKVDGLA